MSYFAVNAIRNQSVNLWESIGGPNLIWSDLQQNMPIKQNPKEEDTVIIGDTVFCRPQDFETSCGICLYCSSFVNWANGVMQW